MSAGSPDENEVSRVILDPSVLFTDEALGWMEDRELRSSLVVSEALWQRLQDPEGVEQFLPFADDDQERITLVRDALQSNEIARFSLEEALSTGVLPEGGREICEALLRSEEELADVLADEWAFLASQSLAIIAERMRHSLDAFIRAGAEVIERGREDIETALSAVRERIPPRLLEVMKHADDPVVKLVVLGGQLVALVVPVLELPAEVVHLAHEGIVVLAGDP
jgi:hypothetical protein